MGQAAGPALREGTRRSLGPAALPACLTGATATAIGLLQAGRLTIWYDEAVTLSLVDRSLGETWAVLREVDAVHGFYYLVLRVWALVAGDSIEAVRAFSAIGVGVAAAATVVLVVRHTSLPTAIAAGLFTGVVPGVSWAALDARSYAWSAAFAVLATLALDSACRHRQRRWWALYGVVATLACWWHLYLALLLVAHGLAILVGLPRARRAWAATAAGIVVGLAPLAVIAWQQRGQVAWLLDVHFTAPVMVLNELTSAQRTDPAAVRPVLAAAVVVLAGYGIHRLWRDDRRWLPAVLALWGGLPTLVAIGCALAGAGMHPRYVTFAVPAFSIAAAIGAAALPRWTPAVAAVAGVLLVAPVHVAQRAPDAKPEDMRTVAALAADVEADAVYFNVPMARSVAYAYPERFAGLPDLSAPADPAPDPFFPGVRDDLGSEDVAGLDVLVYTSHKVRVAHQLVELGCHRRPVGRDRFFLVRLYRCP